MGNLKPQPIHHNTSQNKCVRLRQSVYITYHGATYVIAKEGRDAHAVTFTKHSSSQQQLHAALPTEDSLIQQGQQLYFDAIYGITTLSQKTYLILITSSHEVGQIKNKPIYRADEVEFVQIGNEDIEDRFENYLKQSFKLCALYFSSYNLTQRLQFSYQNPPYYQHSYFTNYLYTLSYKQYPFDLLTKFIIGYVETKSFHSQGTSYRQTIISRANFNNIGRRWLRRGLDSSAHAANSFEVEHVVEISKQNRQHVYSYLQLRGSIPVLWSQAASFKVKPSTGIHKDQNLNAKLFKQYMQRQQNLQRNVHIINLLGRQNVENSLGKLYEYHFNNLKPQSTCFTSWDYQHQQKHKGKTAFQQLMITLQPQISNFTYFKVVIQKDEFDDKVESHQQGTFRTNCLDSVDRTNYVQMLFAKIFALNALNNYQHQQAQITIDPYVSLALPQLQQDFKQLWINSGNQISYQNSGTQLMKLDFYNDGSHTAAGKFNDFGVGFRRHIFGHFIDYYFQNCMDLHFKKLSLQQEQHDLEGSSLKRLLAFLSVTTLFLVPYLTWNFVGQHFNEPIKRYALSGLSSIATTASYYLLLRHYGPSLLNKPIHNVDYI